MHPCVLLLIGFFGPKMKDLLILLKVLPMDQMTHIQKVCKFFVRPYERLLCSGKVYCLLCASSLTPSVGNLKYHCLGRVLGNEFVESPHAKKVKARKATLPNPEPVQVVTPNIIINVCLAKKHYFYLLFHSVPPQQLVRQVIMTNLHLPRS